MRFNSIYSAYLTVLAIIMIAFYKLIALGIVLFIPILIVGLVKKEFKFKVSTINLLFIGFYVLYAFYALYTRHSDWAGTYLENKLAFVLFPFIFSFVPSKLPHWNWIAKGTIAASLFLVIQGLFHSYSCSIETHSSSCYLTTSFSYIHHPTYAAVYFTVSIFLLWYLYRQHKNRLTLSVAISLSFVFVLAVGLCMSFAGLLYLLFATGVAVLVWVKQKWGNRMLYSALILLPVLFFIIVRYEPHLRGEYLNAKQFAIEYAQDPEAFIRTKKYPMSGSEIRLVMWTASMQVAKDFPGGVGTGNVDEVLATYLRRMDQQELAAMNYNPHNQYLQTAVEIGLFGLFVLFAILFIAFKEAKTRSNWLLLLITGSLFFNMLFESMLQRQSGIVFFTFALCLLVFLDKMKMNTPKYSKGIQINKA